MLVKAAIGRKAGLLLPKPESPLRAWARKGCEIQVIQCARTHFVKELCELKGKELTDKQRAVLIDVANELISATARGNRSKS